MATGDEAAKALIDYLNDLRSKGEGPKHFAAFSRNLTGSDGVNPEVNEDGDDNLPGFEYLQRVSTAAFRAVTSHGEELNSAWSEIRRGRYSFDTAMKSWAKLTENYYGVFTEALRGPVELHRPAWLIIPYSKSQGGAPAFSVRIDGVLKKGTPLEYTKFEGVGATPSAITDIYEKPPEAVGSRIHIRLSDTVIKSLPENSDHVGFIFRKGVGNAPPLVIVVLRVTA
jgi:hypothetical protein